MQKLLIIWGNWGPYHYARFRALHEIGGKEGLEVHGLEMFPSSGYYEWTASAGHPAIHHLKLGEMETDFNLPLLVSKLLPLLNRLRPDVIFVPSYWHWSLFINMSGRLLGAKIVMMNESHAGTEKARGFKRVIKKAVVRNFHAALVGGSPHRRHFANLGLDASRIFLGYDAVDNAYFKSQSDAARLDAESLRNQYCLPEKYFLNLGRMVRKKNLHLLIQAYALLAGRSQRLSHDLVLVGSGEESESLRSLCRRLKLAVADHNRPEPAEPVAAKSLAAVGRSQRESSGAGPAPGENRQPTVHFYGFRQIQENPIFYALASAFILPSSMEEWGLVVNEAMASGLPVIVSRHAGCVEDLVRHGRNGFTFDPESEEDLAAALAKVEDQELASSMGSQSERIVGEWGCERFAAGALCATRAAAGGTS